MKKLFALSVLIIAVASPAMSADMPYKAKAPAAIWYNDILSANNQISVDAIYTKMDYVENYPCANPNPGFPNNCAPGIFDQEHGWLPGVSVTGSWMGDVAGVRNLYLMGSGSWVKGNVNYSAGNGLTLVNGAEIWNGDFRIGKGFDISPTGMITPYFGAGGNWWGRNLVGPGGYHEDYKHGYAGGGIMLQFVPISKLVLSMNALIGSTFNSSMTTSLTPGGFPINPQTYKLGNTLMFDAGVSLDYAFTQQFHGNVGFDYQRFGYRQSPLSVIDGSLEPTSRTDYYTVKAGVGYSFYAPAIVARY